MRFLVADDHAVFRVGLLYLLQRLDPEAEILEASDYAEALDIAEREEAIDLILVDLLMPGVEGFSGISGLRDRARAAPIIVVSARENPADVQASLDNGAMGYLPKSSSSEVMLNAIRLVLAGGMYLPPALLGRQDGDGRAIAIESNLGQPRLSEQVARSLTRRQRDVMRLLALGRSNKAIAQELELAEGTVKVHVSAIFKALNVTNRTEAVIIAGKFEAEEDS
ncbi:MAG: response regulator transcription factor [Alphaproteobacteria bacterium]|jgi:DNA-binding NarL/FixJ family response regulator|nr:response regulator transcription factor [Alphaproteobacteria bacterium]MDP6590382.1 response regulator transcription factor [Alphaproteobacteria bacterium]MDP6818253.1 response regulator transcription factor [Alphaproteobacteria bacterium]|tara:strand:+ start:406 stop:1074 length:669 start_codon:yes stop_codon:yes gene_type:complete